MRRSLFSVADLEPGRLTAREVMRRLGVRSRRTITAYTRRGLLSPGSLASVGRSSHRLWTETEVNDAAIALAVHGLPAPQARRLDDLRDRGNQQRRAKRSVAELASQVARKLGASALVAALRPLGLDSTGLDEIEPSRRAAVRLALARALGGTP